MIPRKSFRPATTVSRSIGSRQISRLDRRRRGRIGRLDAHEAATLRPQLTNRCDEARKRVQRRPRRFAAEDDEVHLHIGRRHVCARAEETAGIAGADREQSLPEQGVAHSGADPLAPAVDHVVHRDRLGAAILDADLEVILKVFADAGHVGGHADAMRAQQRGRSEPGKLHQLRRVERAAGQDDLAAGAGSPRRAALPVFDPDRAPPLKQDAARQRVGFDDEIGSAARLAADSRPPSTSAGHSSP